MQPGKLVGRTLVNLTPHNIVVRLDGTDQIFPPDGRVCRCQVETVGFGTINGVGVVQNTFGDLEGLPEPNDGVVYIVSTVAAQKAASLGRKDVISPDTGPTAIREGGQIKAVIRFQCF